MLTFTSNYQSNVSFCIRRARASLHASSLSSAGRKRYGNKGVSQLAIGRTVNANLAVEAASGQLRAIGRKGQSVDTGRVALAGGLALTGRRVIEIHVGGSAGDGDARAVR